MKSFTRNCLIAIPLMVGSLGIHAETIKSKKSNLSITSSAQIIKNSTNIEALTEEQVYDLTHQANLYNLFMIDHAFNISDQYVDRIVASAKTYTDVDFMRLFAEYKLTQAQKNEFNDYIKAERKKNGFDLTARANLLVRLDNAVALNHFKATGMEVPKKPENFREFNVDDYFNYKYDAYILGVEQIIKHQLDEYEVEDLVRTAGVLPKQSLINKVQNTPFKKKLRELIVQEIKERNLSDMDKAYIVFWCDLLTNHAQSKQAS